MHLGLNVSKMTFRTFRTCRDVVSRIPADISPSPVHREVRHLQVAEIVVKSMMDCDQGTTTPSYQAG